jgi:hypothetical protein
MRSASDCRDRMSGWRWLLFMAMARYEASELAYLRIPTVNAPPEPFLSRILRHVARPGGAKR